MCHSYTGVRLSWAPPGRPVPEDERKAMQALFGRGGKHHYEGLEEDEEAYVKHSRVSRRFLYGVLWHPDRPDGVRCAGCPAKGFVMDVCVGCGRARAKVHSRA